MYTNQTGQFPKKSSHGNQYIMVLIELDSNAILVKAMKNHMAGKMICAYQTLVDCLHSAGIQPKIHLLDNECSAEFKEWIKLNQMKYLPVPSLQKTTGGTLLRQPSKSSKPTSSFYAGVTSPSRYTYGTDYSTSPGRKYSQHATTSKDDTICVSFCIPLGSA
jgi:hypothetical protein